MTVSVNCPKLELLELNLIVFCRLRSTSSYDGAFFKPVSHVTVSLKEESSDDSTIISSQTSTLTRNQVQYYTLCTVTSLDSCTCVSCTWSVNNSDIIRLERFTKTRKHSSRMRSTRLPTIHTRRQYWRGGPVQ